MPANNWTKLLEFIDYDQREAGRKECDGSNNAVIRWDGPVATFTWDQQPDMKVDYLSREIEDPPS